MNLGSLATIGWTAPENLVLIVWDNEEYGTTGGQKSATAHGADLAAAARALGIRSAVTVRSEPELRSTIADVRGGPGPHVIVAKVQETAPTMKPPLDYILIKDRFMAAIGSHQP